MVAHALPPLEAPVRLDGCTAACEIVRAIVPGRLGRHEIILHDPIVHQEYGGRLAVPAAREVVRTGALAVDLTASTVLVNGQERRLMLRQWDVLSYLARRPGVICSKAALIRGVWSAGATEADQHMLRSVVNRLRANLGECGRLVENRQSIGYRLRMEPPIGGES
jgi:DNA-binding response OmpR family regulator